MRKAFAQADDLGLPMNREIVFADGSGERRTFREKQALKACRPLAGVLKKILEPDEYIQYMTIASSPTTFFEWLAGPMMWDTKNCLLIFTNRRIVHFPTSMMSKPRGIVTQILYADIVEVAPRLTGLRLFYESGRQEMFSMSDPDRAMSFLPNFIAKGQGSEARERHHLCPRCQAVLRDVYTCPRCLLRFKSRAAATLHSILWPGGGYFYARQYFPAAWQMAVELATVYVLFPAFTYLAAPGNGHDGLMWFVIIALGGALVLEKLAMIYHAGRFVKEYIPVEKGIWASLAR